MGSNDQESGSNEKKRILLLPEYSQTSSNILRESSQQISYTLNRGEVVLGPTGARYWWEKPLIV